MMRYHKKRSRKSRRNPSKRKSRRSSSRRRNPAKRKRRSPLKGRKHSHFGKVRSHKRRVNPKRRRNPSVKGFIPSKDFLLQAATVVAGFIGGKFIISKIPALGAPESVVNRIVPGALSILAGAFMVKQSNKHLKNAGIGIAAAGVANLVSNFVPGMQNLLGTDLSASNVLTYGDDVVRVGDEMVQVGADLSGDDDGSSVYESM